MRTYLYILVFLSFCCSSCAQLKEDKIPEDEITKILFIGNSYLYYNSATEIFNAMVSEKLPNQKILTTLISEGEMTLENHFQNKETLKVLQSEKWDYVVLQEQSNLGSGVFVNNMKYPGSMEPFFTSSRKFYNEIKKTGAKTAFLMTWSGKDHPERQDYLTHAYTAIAKELNAILIPAGVAWHKERQKSQYDLYANDGYHPSVYGSYLVASSIFSTLYKICPIGITGKLDGYTVDETGNKSLLKSRLTSLSNKDAESIHNSCWTIHNVLKKSRGFPPIGEKPTILYSIPELPIGSKLDKDILYGTWEGTSRFDFVSDGLRLTFSKLNTSHPIAIDIVRDHSHVSTTIINHKISDDSILINFKDENDRVREIKIVKHQNHLKGIITSTKGNYIKYDTITFSKQ